VVIARAIVGEEMQMEQRLIELQAAHQRALRQLAKRDAATQELVAAVYQAAKDAAVSVTIPPVPAPKPSGKKGEAEALTILLGDWQLGKSNETYSIDIAKARIELLARKVARLIELHGVPVKEINVALLGDFVESDGNIFPSQSFEVERGGLYVQIFEGAGMLAQFVRAMAALAPRVFVRGAIGNHGRLGRFGDHSNESNADAILYRIAKEHVRDEKRIDWRESLTMGGRHWYDMLDLPGGKRMMLVHGDQFKGGSFGLPYYSIAKRAQGWNLSIEPMDYLAFGHWHTPSRLVLSDGAHTVWGNASIESGNRYAQEWLAASGTPAQWAIFFGKEGPTAEYLVRLDAGKSKA
jgi:hypothetical protein